MNEEYINLNEENEKNQENRIQIANNNDIKCKICLEFSEGLVYPCKCKFPVHKKCLEKWIISSNNNNPKKCEICNLFYNTDIIIINIPENNRIENNIIDDDNFERNVRNVRIMIIKQTCLKGIFFLLIVYDSYYFYTLINNYYDNLFEDIFIVFINIIVLHTMCTYFKSNRILNN